MIWFTADYHLGHANIIKYCHRPFKDLDEMNKTITRNHNSRVKEDDIIYHIGDFCFKNSLIIRGEGDNKKAITYEHFLNGKIIHILGNHDKNNSVKDKILSATLFYHNHNILLTHIPPMHEAEIPDFCDIVFCGHVHEKWEITYLNDIPIVNVGVDVWKFMPVNINEIMTRIKRNKKFAIRESRTVKE